MERGSRSAREPDDGIDPNAAYEKIAETLAGWTSEKVGTVQLSRSSDYQYGQDPVEWMKRQFEEVDMEEDSDEGDLPIATPPKRSRQLDRADTPVMSNASKAKERGKSTVPTTPADSEIPFNVQSPWISQPEFPPTPSTRPGDAMVMRINKPLPGQYAHECRRYHDALLNYLRAKRRVVGRIDLEKQQHALAVQDGAMDISEELVNINLPDTSMLAKEEARAELLFLRALSEICWDRANEEDRNMKDPARKEGNFWLLLASLRELGLLSLVWPDDVSSEHQNKNSLAAYMESLASQVKSPPLELVEALQADSMNCPMVLRRRQHILRWLEQCFNKVLPPGATRARQTNVLSNSQSLVQQGLPETDKDSELLRLSLALILAGRLEDAKKLVRDSGVPWRAAAWSGGTPHGYKLIANDGTQTMDREAVGNTRRPLWKCMMWKHSEKLSQDPKASHDQGAIAAIFSNHLKNALSNPSLRTWEKGLYVTFRAINGRLEDELLDAHNKNRRQMRPSFPGTEYEAKERENLMCTSDVSSMNEAGVIQMLATTPFEEMRREDPISEATSSFIIGKSAIAAYLGDSVELLEIHDDSCLRFLTHLALYIDSLVECTTPIALPGAVEWKNEVLLRYLRHLASREELWHMFVLYASLLPENTIIEYLPELLTRIESQDERKVIVGQMRDLLPVSGLDLVVLKRVVQLVLKEQDLVQAPNTPTRLDVRKMKAILWLSFYEEHTGDALIFSNALLRQFLLSDRLSSAFMFVNDVRPPEILQLLLGEPGMDDEVTASSTYTTKVQHACVEHLAFQHFLDAAKAVDELRDVVANTASAPAVVDDQLDTSQLNSTEAAIASDMERRQLVEEKRKAGQAVVTAASKAQKQLREVLEYEGGWLCTEDEEIVWGEEELARRSELNKLRVKILPDTAMRFYEICMQTSEWMSASLDDAVQRLGGRAENVLATLDESTDSVSSPLAPQYWTRQAMELAQMVTTETNAILSALGTAEIKELLSKLADATVSDLLHSAKRD